MFGDSQAASLTSSKRVEKRLLDEGLIPEALAAVWGVSPLRKSASPMDKDEGEGSL